MQKSFSESFRTRSLSMLILVAMMLLFAMISPSLAGRTPSPNTLQTSFISTDSQILQGTPNALVGTLDLYNSSSSSITVTGVTARTQGTAQAVMDISTTRMWLDDGDKVFEPLTPISGTTKDTTLTASSIDQAILRATNTNIKITAKTHKYVFITSDLSWTADVGKTRQAFILNGDVTVTSPATVAGVPDVGLIGSTMTIADRPDNYKIVATASTPDTVARGSVDNVVQILTLSLDGNVTTVNSIKVTRAGNTTDTATYPDGVKLWNDIDNSGSVNSADKQLSTTTNFSSGISYFNDIDLDVHAGLPLRLLITCSISSNAPLGTYIGTQITDNSSIVVNPEDIVKLARTPLGGVFYDPFGGNTLIVNGLPLSSANVQPGNTYKVVHGVALSALDGNDISMQAITYKMIGTASAADIITFKLIEDINKNGSFDSADTIIDIKSPSGEQLNFTLPEGWMVPAHNTRNLLVTVDIAKSAKLGATIRLVLENSSSITIDSDNTVLAFDSIYGPTLTISGKRISPALEQGTTETTQTPVTPNTIIAPALPVSVDTNTAASIIP